MRLRFTREFHLILTCIGIFAMIMWDVYRDCVILTDDGGLDISEWAELIAGVAVGILMVFIFFKRNDKRLSTMLLIVGVMLFAGVSNFAGLELGTLMSMDFDPSEFLEILLKTLISLMTLALLLISVACTIGYYLGYVHNITRLVIINLGIILLLLLPWILGRYVDPEAIRRVDILIEYLPDILIRVFFILYLIRSDIIDMSVGQQLKVRLARVESTMIMHRHSYMEREDMERMLGMTDEGWRFPDYGPVEKFCEVKIIAPNKRVFTITVRKWRGEDFYRALLTSGKNSNGSSGMAFDIVDHVEYSIDGKAIMRIYGHEGQFVDIYMENPRVGKENKVSNFLDMFVREF